MARKPHKQAHPECPYGATTWAQCDAAFKNVREDWDAMQQVILAYNIAAREVGKRAEGYRGDSLFDQLVRLIRGQQQDLMAKNGNPHEGPFAIRLRAAIERFKAGDLPAYNLYEPVPPSADI